METRNPLSVFIVEKHPIMQKAICRAIKSVPDLTVAGVVALPCEVARCAKHLAPDAVILALEEPGFEGLAMIPNLRDQLPDTRILVLISADVPGQDFVAQKIGAHAVLAKTEPWEVLLHTLRSFRNKNFSNVSK